MADWRGIVVRGPNRHFFKMRIVDAHLCQSCL